MGVIIQEYTYKYPIQMIGTEAGVCYGTDVTNKEKNYKRGIDCLESNHGRTWEFPDVYMILDEYSARVFREWYTHIGGAPTRLQASTRYINYQKGFEYFTPPSIENNKIIAEKATKASSDAQAAVNGLAAKLDKMHKFDDNSTAYIDYNAKGTNPSDGQIQITKGISIIGNGTELRVTNAGIDLGGMMYLTPSSIGIKGGYFGLENKYYILSFELV